MRRHLLSHSALMTVLSIAVVIPASAQQDQRQHASSGANQQQREQQMQHRRDDQRRDDQRRDDQRRDDQRRNAQRQQVRLDPQGQVMIGIDTDGDRRFEKYEAISFYELEQARKRSAQRRQLMRDRSGRTQQQSQRASAQNRQQGDQARSRQQQLRKLTGTITQSETFRLADGPQHNFVKIQTEQGTKVPVDLGRIEQVRRLNLQNGDQITVYGTLSRMNDKKFLSARRIEADGRSMSVGRERDRDLKRVRGEITSLSTKRFRGQDQPFRVAKVELPGGRTETVILGPAERLRNVELQEGDTVQMLVRRGRYNDQPTLIADQIRAAGKTVRVTRPEGSRFTAQRDGQQNRPQNRQR